jgi:hypothetical protein
LLSCGEADSLRGMSVPLSYRFSSSIAWLLHVTLYIGILVMRPCLATTAFAQSSGEDSLSIDGLLPGPVDGWSAKGDDLHHRPDKLFEYIDGGAEMYLSYGFRAGVSRTYARAGQPEITVDIFDMGAPGNAFGVFMESIERVDTTYGQGAQISRGMIVFWKDRFYASILVPVSTPDAERVIARMARAIDDGIPRKGRLPLVLSLLPEASLARESMRYFTHHIWQNSAFFISNDNILDIGKGAEAALARYTFDGHTIHALVISYPDTGRADRARERFDREYHPAKPELNARSIRAGNLLLVAFGLNAGTEPPQRWKNELRSSGIFLKIEDRPPQSGEQQ